MVSTLGRISDEMDSIKHLQDGIDLMESLAPIIGEELIDSIGKEREKLNDLVYQIETFSEKFSDRGWIMYGMMPLTLIKNVNDVCSEKGVEEAEKVLILYYSTEVENKLYRLKSGCDELATRYQLILKAYEDHKSLRYHASVPLFLMIVDGAVNDYKNSNGFFAKNTDVDAWDCLVGCSDGLTKLKNIYSTSRTNTNTDPIYLPYRHGILHGRDLNYDNVYVSSKCIVLLFAIHDWMINKESEDTRRQKLLYSQKEISLKVIFGRMFDL